MKNFKNTLIQISKNGMGTGDEDLGLQLISNYLKLLNEENEPPKFVTFYNGGVKLICAGSPVIDILKNMEKKGINLIACKTCLSHFGLIDKVKVGISGTMVDIIEIQKSASKIIDL